MPETLLLGRVCAFEHFRSQLTSFQTYVITGAVVEAPYSKSGQPSPTGMQLRFVESTKYALDPNASATFSVKCLQDLEVCF
jgi:hypothetical protein